MPALCASGQGHSPGRDGSLRQACRCPRGRGPYWEAAGQGPGRVVALRDLPTPPQSSAEFVGGHCGGLSVGEERIR